MSNSVSIHLGFIQQNIQRFGQNSFMCKGWSLTLVLAVLAFTGANQSTGQAVESLVPLIIVLFWYLDGYFLRLERLFRNMYDKVRKLKNSNYDLSVRNYKTKWEFCQRFCCMVTLSNLIFYLPLITMACYIST